MLNSSINYKNLLTANRLDPEYFQKNNLAKNRKAKIRKTDKLKNLCEFILTGPPGSVLPASAYAATGIKLYRPSNLDGWSGEKGSFAYITPEYCAKHKIKIFHKNDILITRIGDIKFALIGESEKFTISPNLIVLRTIKNLLYPFFLLALLNSPSVFGQIHRGTKNAALSSINLHHIADLNIPRIPISDQKRIGARVKQAILDQDRARLIYNVTQEYFLKAIKFTKKKKNKSSLKNNFSAILEEQRLDAEYFINKNNFGNSKIKFVKLTEICEISRGIEPGRENYTENGVPFLRPSNIDKLCLLKKSQKFISHEQFNQLAKKFNPLKGEILLVKDGKPGVAFVLKDTLNAIISDGIVRLKIKKTFSPEYIAFCINSAYCQDQIIRGLEGSLIPHWQIKKIEELKIPITTNSLQKNILKNLNKVFELENKTRNNLDLAISMVD